MKKKKMKGIRDEKINKDARGKIKERGIKKIIKIKLEESCRTRKEWSTIKGKKHWNYEGMKKKENITEWEK